MKLPTFDELADDQLTIWDHDPDKALFVLGPPGSGKTSLAIWRARYVSTAPLSQSVKIITRNRLLASSAEQVSRADADRRVVSATTMHRFVSSDYYARFNDFAPEPQRFIYDWARIIAKYETAKIVPTLGHLIIDEGQNLPPGFFAWAVRFGAKVVTVFSDENQTTMSEHSSIADILSAGLPAPVWLSKNYRNCEEIVELMEQFHRSRVLPPASVRVDPSGERPSIRSIGDWHALVSMVTTRFRNRGSSIGVIVEKSSDVAELRAKLSSALDKVRIDSYTHESPSGTEALIKLRDPGVTVLTGESAIGLEFESVFLQDLARSLPIGTDAERRRLYMLCARASKSLVLVNGTTPLTAAQLASLPDARYLER
ncbi:AAA family ATPase [Variovorax sp. PDNC026]|uniref:AAA family ATPase n=1 Tax=Variovorax sp. PDNC026 TaxID=2811425 RepID=UPI0019633862|nr:AAA family ATPase [Variovorax sp. PDNC026]QRY33536.1 AAA family ATPase [Variovorax sp. PDNC026]